MGFNLDTQATRSALMSVATTLAANIDATQDYIPVASTANFSTSVVAEVESTNEVVSFTDISENILTYSQTFDSWSKAGATVSTNAAVAPDGTTTADLVTFTTTSYNSVYQTATVVSGVSYTFSVYAKSGNQNEMSLEHRQSATSIDAVFNLDTGTVTSGSGTITSVGDGWYRCSTVGTTADTSDVFIIGRGASGPAGETCYLWGAQAEQASTPTTYLPTTSAGLVGLTNVTRGANGTTAASATSGDDIQQLPYALLNVDMPVRLKGLSVSSDGTGAGRLTLCDKVGTHLCDVDIPDTKIFDLTFDGGILFPNGIYVANSDNITAYTLYTDKYSGDSL